MTIQFVDVSVDTSGLVPVQTRDYGTVAVVGTGVTASGSIDTTPVRIGTVSEAAAIYPTDSDLYLGIKNALENGAASVVAVDIGPDAKTTTTVETGLAAILAEDVQIVALANTVETDANAYISDKLAAHIDAATTERIGVFMLDKDENASTAPANVKNMLTANKNRMFGIAHKTDSDVATIVAGALAKRKPWESPVIKPLTNIVGASAFTTTEITALDTAQINPLFDPVYLIGTGYVLRTGYTMGLASDGIHLVDVRRTLDDITYKLKAALTNPSVIGHLRINKPGVSELSGRISALLQTAVTAEEIDDFGVSIPVLNALSKPEAIRSDPEKLLISSSRTARTVSAEVSVTYSGAIHKINIDLKFVA